MILLGGMLALLGKYWSRAMSTCLMPLLPYTKPRASTPKLRRGGGLRHFMGTSTRKMLRRPLMRPPVGMPAKSAITPSERFLPHSHPIASPRFDVCAIIDKNTIEFWIVKLSINIKQYLHFTLIVKHFE